jgi:hypothetical protein
MRRASGAWFSCRAKNRSIVTSTTALSDWKQRVLNADSRGADAWPAWWTRAYRQYRATLDQPDYPCFFGQTAERRGEMFYAFCDRAREPHAPRETMTRFASLGAQPAYARHSLAMFVEPDESVADHEAFVARFWQVLQRLHDSDRAPMEPANPDDPLWEFLFVVGTSPAYRRRRSRVVGDGMVLLFQPRELFVDPATGQPISADVRKRIHARMLAYDGMPVHPDIGFYGDPRNREWKQYCLPDDDTPVQGVCPFSSRR